MASKLPATCQKIRRSFVVRMSAPKAPSGRWYAEIEPIDDVQQAVAEHGLHLSESVMDVISELLCELALEEEKDVDGCKNLDQCAS